MSSENSRQFTRWTLIVTPLTIVLAAVLSPPDPFTLVLWLGVLLPIGLILSYVLSYRLEYEM